MLVALPMSPTIEAFCGKYGFRFEMLIMLLDFPPQAGACSLQLVGNSNEKAAGAGVSFFASLGLEATQVEA